MINKIKNKKSREKYQNLIFISTSVCRKYSKIVTNCHDETEYEMKTVKYAL